MNVQTKDLKAQPMMPDRDELTPEEARRDHWEMLRFLAVNALFWWNGRAG